MPQSLEICVHSSSVSTTFAYFERNPFTKLKLLNDELRCGGFNFLSEAFKSCTFTFAFASLDMCALRDASYFTTGAGFNGLLSANKQMMGSGSQ